MKRISRRKTRGAKLRPEVEALIVEKALEDMKKPRGDVATELLELIRKDGYPVPEKSTIMKRISAARNSPREIDMPWSLATLNNYAIPPDALPVIVDIARHTQITIRMAKWIGRLYVLREQLSDRYPLSGAKKRLLPAKYWRLCKWASRYAEEELISELIGKPFDSNHLDTFLLTPEGANALNPIEPDTIARMVRQVQEQQLENQSETENEEGGQQ